MTASARIEGVAVVTGAASGNGAAIAQRLAELGAHVIVADIELARAELTAAALREAGHAVVVQRTDVSDEREMEELADVAIRYGTLMAWVNNAGIIDRTPVLEIEVATWDRLMAVNARGCFLGVRAAGRRMGPGGSIVNLASISSRIALPNTAHYGASKGAVELLTRHAALELGPKGLRVNAVAPGSIRTGMTQERLADPAQLETTLRRIPMGRIGRPEDVARAVGYLCSPDASYVNGATLLVDGGWTAC